MNGRLTIFILGGYGTFGGRIVRLLEDESCITLIIAGRSLAKASSFCKSRERAKARLIPAAFNRDSFAAVQLAAYKPDVLVDASGPFQAYGEARYRVIESCLAQDVNYLDLADGSDFVAGVSAYDVAARTAGRYVLSGVSSFPVLTAAVVRYLSRDLTRIDTIHGGIAPSPYAGVGQNVIRAIAGYAGQKIQIRKDGKSKAGYPLTELMRFTIRPPGRMPLHNRLFSLVDVPDLRALTELWPETKTIWMGAGPVPEILHCVLIALAWLVRFKAIPALAPLTPLMYFSTRYLRWGEHRGGMFVEIEGTDASGASLVRSWHLLAEGDDGPLIPSMAVEALVRRSLEGHPPLPGARAAIRELELDDYETLFASRTIYTGVRDETSVPDETSARSKSLYTNILGSAWANVPPGIRAMHEGLAAAHGRASVERGRGLIGRLAAAFVGFPKAVADTPVSVRFDVSPQGEIWTRTFGDERFSSRQFAGRGRSEGLLCERFGVLTFAMALVSEDERLSLVLRRWSAFGIALPMWLCPRSDSYETVVDGIFRFHVEISHPLTGLIVKYEGWLEDECGRLGAFLLPLAGEGGPALAGSDEG